MRTVKIVLITLFVFVLVELVAGEVFLRTHQFGAKDQPSWLERTIAQHARNISVPDEVRALKNPRSVTDETMAEAREHWVEHCSRCHGIDGRGETVIGRNMYPPAPDMTDGQTQQRTDGELFYIVSKGVRLTGMPAWESEDSPESIWDLVAFIRHLPQLSPEELKQMKELVGGKEEEDMSAGEKKPETPVVKPHKDKPGTKPHKHSHEH